MKMKINTLRVLAITILASSMQLFAAQGSEEPLSRAEILETANHFDRLPADAQIHIFNLLVDSAQDDQELAQDITHFALTSKRFNAISQSESGKKRICAAKIKNLVNRIINKNRNDEVFQFTSSDALNQEGQTLLMLIIDGFRSNRFRSTTYVTIPDNYNLAKQLISCGADVNKITSQGVALMYCKDAQMLNLLLANGAQKTINYKNQLEHTLVTQIAYGTLVRHQFPPEELEILKLLINNGADVNIKAKFGSTALHWAARGYFPELVRTLIDAGAKVCIPNDEGLTPYDIAVQSTYKNQEIISMILKQKNKETHNGAQPCGF
jgi:ankyrin repeat protein